MKNAVVWGSSGAIGQAIINQLNSEGWTTVGLTRERSKSSQVAKFEFEINFEDAQNLEETIYLISQEVDEINFWCYAGGDIKYEKVADMTPENWQRIVSANLNNVFSAVHYSLPLLAESAHIFILGAVSERLRLPGLAAYAASKAGLEAFAETLGKEERKKPVTLVRPGAVATPFWDKVPLNMPKEAASAEKVAAKIYEAFLSGHKGTLDLV
jgi:NAD(P)-dependent dehydrogenase (short-subunit alcohol dehydrogenase family)